MALGALGLLLGWAALSLTWAESVQNAWVETDRLVLYAAVLVVSLVAIRASP